MSEIVGDDDKKKKRRDEDDCGKNGKKPGVGSEDEKVRLKEREEEDEDDEEEQIASPSAKNRISAIANAFLQPVLILLFVAASFRHAGEFEVLLRPISSSRGSSKCVEFSF